jgi:rfaE bifunctional protein kinase chain/domain
MRCEIREKSEVVFVSGKFRVIHAGHMRLFRTAKDYGRKLVVALDSEGLSEEEIRWRKNILENIDYVQEVIEFDGDIEKVIRLVRPNIVIKGREFRDVENSEVKALAEYGGKLIFTSGANYYSESELIGSSDSEFIEKLVSMPQQFMARNRISTDQLLNTIQGFSNLRVCVIGDLIIDEYINCHPIGLSQEEPTVVVAPVDKRRFFGGAGIVAAHCKSLGAKTSLITVIGEDETSLWAAQKSAEYRLESLSVVDVNRPTTLKQRYRSGTQTLLKISHLTQDFLEREKEDELIENFLKIAQEIEVLILSDFSYGVLSPRVVEKILLIASKYGIFVSADSQSSSQIGNLGKFKNVNLISATEREARLELKDNTSGLVIVAEGLRKELRSVNLLLKMGGDGVLISAENREGQMMATDEIAAINKKPVDTSGAGDSMLVGASLALATGASIYEAALIGSILAGMQVGRLGNIPISQEILNTLLQL